MTGQFVVRSAGPPVHSRASGRLKTDSSSFEFANRPVADPLGTDQNVTVTFRSYTAAIPKTIASSATAVQRPQDTLSAQPRCENRCAAKLASMDSVHCPTPAVCDSDRHTIRSQARTAAWAARRPGLLPASTRAPQRHNRNVGGRRHTREVANPAYVDRLRVAYRAASLITQSPNHPM